MTTPTRASAPEAPPAPRPSDGLLTRLRSGDFQTRDALFGIVLITPVLIWLGLVVIAPMISAITTSFTSLRVPGAPYEIVGLEQYRGLFGDARFRSSLLRSVVWIVGNGVLQTATALAVALLLNRPFRGQGFVRSWIVLPWVVPVAVIAILWRWMLDASAGVVNGILLGLGLRDAPVVFLGDPSNAFPSLIGMNSWRFFPFLTLIILAALQTVPEHEYEAARIDGASRWLQFRSITFPHILPVLTVLGLVGTLWAANVFDLVWMVTRGGPVDSTTTAPVFIYDLAFAAFNLAPAAAASMLYLLLLVAFAVGFSFLVRRELRQVEETLEETVEERV
ncbi:MAG: carbohydrate ABC transporter permease [Egibacteraceae bacterium]